MTMRIVMLIASLVLFITGAASALEPDRREVVVVHARVWEGDHYEEVFIPSTHSQVTLMAGADSALSFARTLEYFWPLSRQVYVDFETQRDEIAGLLTILSNGKILAEIRPQDYAILYPESAVKGNAKLLWGEAALRARADHLSDQQEFNRRMVTVQRAHREYERRLLESGAIRVPGTPAEVIPEPPPLPKSSLRLVTEPRPGYRVALPPGDYRMKLSVDGTSIPGTQRRLSVVPAATQLSLVADIVPEERWTRPIGSNTRAARVYARPGTIFYVTLAEAAQVREADYLPVVSPQSAPMKGRTMWLRRGVATNQTLRLDWSGGKDPVDLDQAALKVEQTRGSGFGYRVRAATAGEQSDLEAFLVNVPDSKKVSRGTLRDLTGGIDGFWREVVIVHPRNNVAGFLLAFLPLAAFLIQRGRSWRRRNKGRATSVSAAG